MYNKVANCWRYETVVYGPLWTLICKLLTSISFGNIDVALAIFKGTNLIVHLINCLLIWKITHKKKFVLIYGTNPAILFEALSNVHNDIFIVLFILLAIQFDVISCICSNGDSNKIFENTNITIYNLISSKEKKHIRENKVLCIVWTRIYSNTCRILCNICKRFEYICRSIHTTIKV